MDEEARRMSNAERKMTARLIKMQDDDRSFDVEFWQNAGTDAIFAAAWQMVLEVKAIRGEDGGQSRLQRSVASFRRIRR